MAVAIAGLRCGEIDRALGDVERIVVIGGAEWPTGLANAALADARAIGPPVTTASLPPGPATRGLLALGYVVPPRIRRSVDRALR